jgi:hypothetical protein
MLRYQRKSIVGTEKMDTSMRKWRIAFPQFRKSPLPHNVNFASSQVGFLLSKRPPELYALACQLLINTGAGDNEVF